MAIGRKTGGRKAGTPNKVTSDVRQVIAKMVSGYYTSKQWKEDMKALDPKDRVSAYEKYTNYVMPKIQSVALDFGDSEKKKTIEDTLSELAKEND
ncbi:hypothetical protein OCV73_02585 [Barnesiella propionica]|uniref:hypothetical protein n=1 Tax=Barnesiella propionica TaxID=2981781 RepID=UPI0011C82C2B|nr:hypothetical protein [Barnesiella propionica]MCU6767845.1 hypothetical protein [Barnesiella propionica]